MSVTKQGKSWVAKGTVYRSDGTKRYYNRKFDLKREAVEWEALKRNELSFDHAMMTLDEYVHLVQKRDETRIRSSTIENRWSIYNVHIKERFGNMRIDKINSKMIDEWLRGLDCKISSANQMKRILSFFMNQAKKDRLISLNPVDNVSALKDPNKIRDQFSNYWTKDEFETFISAVDNPDWEFIFRLLWNTGMRKGEALALQWKHYKNGALKVEQTLTFDNRLGPPKTSNSYRTVTLSADMRKRLDERLEKMRKIDGFTNDWFITGNYKTISIVTLRNHADYYMDKANVKRITIHGFRHSHASILICSGVNDSLIANRLGHTVTMLHNTYAHIYDDSKTELSETLDKIL